MKGINSIEITKGIAVIIIIFTNTINYWLNYSIEFSYFLSLLITIFELFGSSLLIFVFSFSIIFALRKKMGIFADRKNRNKLLKQFILLILLGIAYNLIFNYLGNRSIVFWGWNILIFVGVGQIICYYIFKLLRWARIVIGIIIILITPYIREVLFFWKESNIIVYFFHQILVSSTPVYPFLPFASLWFFSTIFSELIYESFLLESEIAPLNAVRSIIKYAFIFILLSFIYSAIQFLPFIDPFTYDPNVYPFIDSLPILRGTTIIYVPGIPEALIKGTIQNIFFITGTSLLIIGLTFYFREIRKKTSKISKVLTIFGKSAITLLFFQWLFLPLFNQLLTYYIYLPISLSYVIIIGLIIYLWEKNINLKYNIEWLIRIISRKENEEV
ncbi:MAG: hypothetical protein ACFFFB_23610, partial [Candidatus Heimdallarchaeota archaeon]